MPEVVRRYTAVEAFCGAGGLSMGLQQAGFDIPLAFDLDAAAVETYRGYFGGHGRQVDIRELTGERLAELTGGLEVDLVSGGPPCQGFSKQKRGAHLGDERNHLVVEHARLVRELNPRFFLLENVAMFGQKRGRDFVERIAELLPHYELRGDLYNCAHFGLPQTRRRYILVGRRRDVRASFRPPEAETAEAPTLREIIGDLPEPPADHSTHPDHPNHQRARVTPINIERFSHVPPGGGWRDIPEQLRLACHRNVDPKKGGWPDVYGRLEWDKPCPTITGGFDSFTRGRYGHPEAHRPLTPREAARIQGFPDDFVFHGNRSQVRRQIGNAVPPPLARALGRALYDALRREDDAARTPRSPKPNTQRNSIPAAP